jgi:AcrR family transcriptional regulator
VEPPALDSRINQSFNYLMRRKPAAARPPADTRDRIARAGRILFAERGFDGTGIRQLAERAGVNVALIQYHFGGKRGLLNHVLGEDLAWATAQLRSAVDRAQTARAKLAAFTRTLAEVGGERPWLPFILTREQMDGARRLEPAVCDRLFDFFRVTGTILETGRATGEFRALDPHAAHLSLMGALVYFSLTEPARQTYARLTGVPGPPLTSSEYLQHVRELFERGMAASLEPRPPSTARIRQRRRP